MSFPLNSNQAYIKNTGERTTLGAAIGAGGSTPTSELPEYSEADAGKVLKVANDGTLEWDEDGGAGGVLVGTDAPTSDLGENGNYYYKRNNNGYGVTAYGTLQGSGTTGYGNVYHAAVDLTIKGIRAMCTQNKTGTISIGDLTQASETSGSLTFTANQWTTYMLATPVTISAGDDFFIKVVVEGESGGSIAYSTNVTFDTAKATFVKSYYGTTYPGTQDAAKTLTDYIVDIDYYLVDAQYLKTNNAWVQIG